MGHEGRVGGGGQDQGTSSLVKNRNTEAYLDEMVFRFNRRFNPDLFLDTLRHVGTAPVPTLKKLTKGDEAALKSVRLQASIVLVFDCLLFAGNYGGIAP